MVKKILYSLVLLVVFLVHVSYVPNSFVWLDHGDIEKGRAIVSLDRLPNTLFTRFGQTGFYRPAISFTESLDYAIYKDWAPGYHLTNVVLHLLVVALLPLFISAFFTFSFFEILLAMLLVGMHPLTWLPVGAISYRPEMLLAIFVMLTVYLHAQARTTGRSHFEFLTIISFFLGLLAKETAIFLIPALIVLWETIFLKVSKVPKVSKVSKAFRHSGLSRISNVKALLFREILDTARMTGFRMIIKPFTQSLFLSELFVIALYLLLRLQAVPEMWRLSGYDLSLGEAIGTRVIVFIQLLMQFISPFKPDLSDAVLVRGLDSFVIVGCLAVIGVGVWVVKKTGIFSSWSKVLFLFFIMLVPALGIVPVPRLGSPHYGYIALPAFAVLIVLLLKIVSPNLKKGVYILFFAWICFMSYSTFMSGYQFKNDLTLFAPEVKKDPYFLEGYFYLGNYYLLNNDLQQAEEMYNKALKDHPRAIIYNEKESVRTNLDVVRDRMEE